MTEKADYAALGSQRFYWPRIYLLYITLGLYICLVGAFVADFDGHTLYLLGALATLACFLLMMVNFVSSLYLAVLVLHIGPIVKLNINEIGIVTLGDLYLVLIFFIFLARSFKKQFILVHDKLLLFCLLLLCLISFFFAADTFAVIPGAVNMVQLGGLYFVLYNEIKTRQEANNMILGIGLGVLVSALLHLIFYSRGISLSLSGQDPGQLAVLQDKAIATQYIRTAFFYVSFIASSAVGIVLGIYYLLNVKNNKWVAAFWLFVVLSAISSSLVSFSKTTLLAAGTISFFIVSTAFLNIKRTSIGRFLIIFIVFFVGPIYVLQFLALESQQKILLDSIISDSVISMNERFIMWGDFFGKIITSPKELIIGLGVGLPERMPDNQDVRSILYISGLQFQPHSFHNFYLDMIMELGIIIFSLIIFIIINTLKRLRVLIRSGDELSAPIFFAILVWLLVWMTHSTGWNKPLGILSVLFALAHLLIDHRLKSRPNYI